MGLFISPRGASDHGEPRSAWWAGGIQRLFVSVRLAGVRFPCFAGWPLCVPVGFRTVFFLCFVSGCVSRVIFRFNPCGFFQVRDLWFFQVRGLWLFRVAPCGFSMLIFVCVLVTDLFVCYLVSSWIDCPCIRRRVQRCCSAIPSCGFSCLNFGS